MTTLASAASEELEASWRKCALVKKRFLNVARRSGCRGALRIKLVRGETTVHQNRAYFEDRWSPPALAAGSH